MTRQRHQNNTHVSLARIATEADEGPKTILFDDDTARFGEPIVKAVVTVVAATARMARENFIFPSREEDE